VFVPGEIDPVHRLTVANRKALGRLTAWLTQTPVRPIIPGIISLCRPPDQIIANVESAIVQAARRSDPAREWKNELGEEVWATDGSVRPAHASQGERRSITSAVVGPRNLCTREFSRTNCIAHGEVKAIILALILIRDGGDRPSVVFTDHLNAQRTLSDLINDPEDADRRLATKPARNLYRWAWSLLKDMPRTRIVYTPAHTGGSRVQDLANEEADRKAGEAHTIEGTMQVASPSGFMDQYATCVWGLGWTDRSLPDIINEKMNSKDRDQLALKPRMEYKLYDRLGHPCHPYNKAVASYSTTVQLYARSGQLPVGMTIAGRNPQQDPMCSFECGELETIHHIMVECPEFTSWRWEAARRLGDKVESILTPLGTIDRHTKESIRTTARSYFHDSPAWPLLKTQFYYGHVPKSGDSGQDLAKARLLKNVHDEMHYAGIRLAGRIHGSLAKARAKAAYGKWYD
jgi:hypothetical protein